MIRKIIAAMLFSAISTAFPVAADTPTTPQLSPVDTLRKNQTDFDTIVRKSPEAATNWREKRDLQKIQTAPTNPKFNITNPTKVMTGIPVVEDGDTLNFQGLRVWLAFVDAPELGQFCRSGTSKTDGGETAKRILQGLIDQQSVTCHYVPAELEAKPLTTQTHVLFPKVPVNWGLCGTPTVHNLNYAMFKSGWVFLRRDFRSNLNNLFGLPDFTIQAHEAQFRRVGFGVRNHPTNNCVLPEFKRDDPRP